jgi:hypothetical protein
MSPGWKRVALRESHNAGRVTVTIAAGPDRVTPALTPVRNEADRIGVHITFVQKLSLTYDLPHNANPSAPVSLSPSPGPSQRRREAWS